MLDLLEKLLEVSDINLLYYFIENYLKPIFNKNTIYFNENNQNIRIKLNNLVVSPKQILVDNSFQRSEISYIKNVDLRYIYYEKIKRFIK